MLFPLFLQAGVAPGSDSIIGAILEINASKSITYVNYDPGMSMVHTVEVMGIDGIYDTISLTIPKGDGMLRRLVSGICRVKR